MGSLPEQLVGQPFEVAVHCTRPIEVLHQRLDPCLGHADRLGVAEQALVAQGHQRFCNGIAGAAKRIRHCLARYMGQTGQGYYVWIAFCGTDRQRDSLNFTLQLLILLAQLESTFRNGLTAP